MVYYSYYSSTLGQILLLSDGESLTGLYMDTQPGKPGEIQKELPVFEATKAWLDAYFRGESPDPSALPLAPKGTAFQEKVWQILLTIPQGQTRSYGDISREMARQLGKEKMSAQAVGQAVGRNPISIIIPCHRVVGTNGTLTGYTGGLDKKTWLLKHENALQQLDV